MLRAADSEEDRFSTSVNLPTNVSIGTAFYNTRRNCYSGYQFK